MDSTQPTPQASKFDPLRCGLFRSMCVYGEAAGGGAILNSRAWNQAVADGHAVGDCRLCGYPVVALPTEVVGRITWYTGRCTNCRQEIASPNGEIMRRSMMHSEQPAGFQEGRRDSKRNGF